jgi:hypothetical protein
VVCAKSQSPKYTMGDLHDLVFPSETGVTGQLCMIYNCFLDDSKDQKQQQMIISAGFFASNLTWAPLRSAWNKCLRGHGLNYFKTSEWRGLSGEFQKYKSANYPIPTGRDAANRVRDELLRILENTTGINGIGMAIPVGDYNEVRDMPESAIIFDDDIYGWALVHVIVETLRAVRGLPGKHMAAFVHDDGNDFDELRAVYKEFMKNNPYWAKHSGGFQPLDDKLHPELQAADMAANYALQLGLKWLSDGRQQQKREEFQKSMKCLFIADKLTLLKILRDQYIHRKIPVPAVLQNLDCP